MAKRVEEIVTENQAQSRRTSIAVSGSSQPGLLAPFFLELAVDWSLVDFFFSDERCVALDHPDSNYGAWNKLLFEKVGLCPCCLFRRKKFPRRIFGQSEVP